ncbi:acyl-CoA synthetase (AMP-forming)/AMP-acid ligase II [Thermocatellispora tengchongensis]|uniref:Acyl-CoA synthetase (AMP-forming)/AMP-acid ligase II n=1 Tax=Thermocatellispora tengchongensis TaxID=1073253 RepID=A0A840P700_9ACTN|nr:AMP-binding protein [Thermocatellispora tengchongensis]MBB5133220.1 acyl-CoA synthetase (AMP-forming)/AMP-acid ligase II [Thermocatellispora tengchongensis]
MAGQTPDRGTPGWERSGWETPGWGTLPRMLRDRAAASPGVVAVAGPAGSGDRLTTAELRARAARFARGLIALGVRPGDRVAVWGVNDASWVVAAYGVWDAGAVIVPLSARYKGFEAAELLASTGARVLVTGEGPGGAVLADLLDGPPGAGEAGGVGGRETGPVVVVPDAVSRPGTLRRSELLARGAAVPEREAEERALAVRPEDLCEIMSTSGTTGTPKGVMLDHAQIVRGYWDWSEIVTLREGDRYPVIAPFAHGFGLNAGLIASVMRGATMMPIPSFSPEGLQRLVAEERITILAGPPALFHRLLDDVDTRGHALRVAICGAAAVPAELIHRLLDEVGLERMINAYGLMEGTVVSMTRADDPVEVIAATAGRPVPGIEVKIVDAAGREVPPGTRGEILQRGYGVMRGYWGEPGKTAEVIRDGWLHTGDIGVLDERGNLAIVDRKKELFIVNGFNVSPAEVEGLLLREGSLAQAAVVGVPDPRSGEAGWAYVVPRPGRSPEPEELIAWARENMSAHKVPRRIVVVPELPVNANGKPDKQALRERARAAVAPAPD